MPSSQSNSSPTIVFLNVPPKTLIGVNLTSFNSAPNFHGITNLPLGLLFIYTGTDASLSIRHGRWLKSTSTSFFVLKWNNATESLDLLDQDDAQTLQAAQSLTFSLRPGLIEYDALRDANATIQAKQTLTHARNADTTSNEDVWPRLISHISAKCCTRILGPSQCLTSVSSSPSDTEHIPGLSALETNSVLHGQDTLLLNFLPINLKQTWPEAAVGPERTEKARDRSWYLSYIVDVLAEGAGRDVGAKELLGELQLCFVAVLTLANYSCLEQWKRILGVLLTCQKALGEIEEYFVEVLMVLRVQLGRVDSVDGGLFEMDDEMGSAWLRALLSGFRDKVDEVLGGSDNKLGRVLAGLEKWLEEEHGWIGRRDQVRKGMVQMEDGEMVEVQTDDYDEEDERGEWAPVIVEM